MNNYESMINKYVKKYSLSELQSVSDKDSEYVKSHYKEEERQEAEIGFWKAIMSYEKNGVLPLPAHLKFKTKKHFK